MILFDEFSMKLPTLLVILSLFTSVIADNSIVSAVYKNSNPETPGYFTIYRKSEGYEAIGTYVKKANPDSQPKVWTASCSSLINKSIECQYVHSHDSELTGKFTLTLKDDDAYLVYGSVNSEDKSHQSYPKYYMIFPTDTTQ